MRRRGAVPFALATWCAAVGARADGSDVLVVGAPSAPETAAIEFEVRAIGLRPQVRPDLDIDAIDVERSTLDVGAILAIRPGMGRRTVWVIDRLTGKTLVRPLPAMTDASPRTVAVAVVELLRASLLELAATRGEATPVAPTAPVREIVARSTRAMTAPAPPPSPAARTGSPSAPWLGGSFGAGITGSWGDLSPEWSARASIDLAWRRWFRASLAGTFSLTPSILDVTEGIVEVRRGFVSLRGGVSLTPRAWRLQASAGAGAGVGWLQARGIGRGGYLSGTDQYVGPRVEAWSRIGVRLSPQTALSLEASGSTLGASLSVRADRREVGAQGAVVFDLLLSASFAFDTVANDS